MSKNSSRTAGRHFLHIPGPSPLPDRILRAMDTPIIDHRGPEFQKLAKGVLEGIKTIFKTANPVIIYTATGTGAWEAALVNTLSPGDRVLMVETGQFATLWKKMAEKLGLKPEFIETDWRIGADPKAIEAKLREDKRHEIKAVCVLHNETSTGCLSPIDEIRKAIDAAGHPALFMVDTVASLGCMPFEMDKWGIDVAMSGSQKGLMTPPGLGFVAANDRAREVHKKANLRTPYWDWTEREGSEHYRKYAGTAPVHLLFALRKAIDMLHVEGLENAFLRHRLLAEAVRRAVAAWSEGQVLGFNIAEANERSNTVTTVTLNGFDPAALQRYCKDKCGVVLGTGIGDLSGQAFRIAHMGHVNAPMILGTLGVIEVGLNALNIPHGKGGTEAAIEYLGESVGA
jgi:alanine-glyoxylate transaminase / serine-glyoxylate transaminase / serine-pyruvate transaminase